MAILFDGNTQVGGITTDSKLNKIVNDNWQGNGYNLIPFPYTDNNGIVNRGITYTYDDSGLIIADGTVSESNLDSFFSCNNVSRKYIELPEGKYKLLSGISDESNTKYWVTVYSGSTELLRSTNNNGILTLTTTTRVYIQCRVYRGTTVSNLVFKPMLVKISEDNSYPTEYQRYALGNVQLTDRVDAINSDLGNKASASSVSGNDAFSKINSLNENQKTKVYTGATLKNSSQGEVKVFEYGKMVYVTIECTPTTVANDTVIVEGLPLPFFYFYLHLPTNTGNGYSALLNTNGNLIIYYTNYANIDRIDCTFTYLKA